MSAQDRAIQKLAREFAVMKKEIVSWRGPQADYTSLENSGNFTFKDSDGNVTAVVGGQDDGSNTIRHVDGPTPPIPSGLTAHVDGPIIQVSWDGSFEDGVAATHDWHYLEVLAVGPNNEQLTGTIDNANGGSTSLAATSQGDWVVVARSVSRAGKRSLDGDAGTVAVELVGLTGAIEAVQASADGKNTIYYSATMPPGTDYVDGDLWFDTSEAGGNRASVWDGGQWLSVADARVADIADAQANIDAAMTVLDGRLDDAAVDITSLQDSLADLDSTTLPALRQDLDAAEGRLDSAEGQITDAFGELDLVPGQIADAKQAAIDAAASDATDKADAAQSAAEAKAADAQQAADDALAAINAGESMWADPGFESSFGPLGSTNPSVVRSDAFAHQGSWSVEYTTTGNGANVYPGYVYVPVTAGRTYRLSAAARSDDGLAFESFFEQRSGGSTVVSSPKLEIAGGVGSFALGDATQTIVDGVSELRLAPLVPAAHNNTAGKKLYLDNFTLTDITESWAMFQEAMTAASDAQTVAGEAKTIAEAAVGAAEGGNTNFFNQSEPSGVGSLAGDRWFQRTATWAIVGMWMWDGSNWVRQTLNNEVIGNLDAGKITFGYMNGDRIEAGTIHADRIASGLSQNMVPDPGFANQQISNHRLSVANLYGATAGIDDGVLWFDVPDTQATNANISLSATADLYAWPAYPEMNLVTRISARTLGSAQFRFTVRYMRRDGSTVNTTTSPLTHTATGTWAEYSSTLSLPVEVSSYSVSIQVQATSRGRVEFRAPFAASAVDGTVIEGGAVTTDKLAANVLEVGNLKAGTAAIAEAVVQKIAAQTASIQTADIKNLFVTGTASLSDVVAERIGAETAEFINLEVANLVASGAVIDEAVIDQLFTDVVVAKMVTATEFIGENAILTGAVTADKMAVGSITAESGIIESLDLGTATVGELDGIRIMGQTVRGEQLSGDAIDGKVITGPTIQSARTGQRWVGDATGIRIFNADNELRTQLSPDGSVFKGEVEADTLVVNGGSELRSTENKLGQGAKLTLEAGVTDPTAPPMVQPYWDGIEFTPTEGKTYYGLAFAGGKYWTFEEAPKSSDGDRLVSIDPGTGAIGDAIPMTENFWATGGVTAIGSELFLLGPKTGTDYKYFVRVYSTAGVFLREWEYPVGWSKTNPLTYKPGIGNNGTDVVIAQCTDAGILAWYTFNKTTGALLTTTVSESTSTSSDIAGIYVGPGDWGGGNRVVVAKLSTRSLLTYSTAGVWDSARSWGMADGVAGAGVVFHDGKFHSLNSSGVIHEYADYNTGDDSGDWWCAYRWETDTDSDETIDYRSKISPHARFTWPRRARLKATGQPKPVGVELMAGYLAKKTTTPSRTDFKRNYTGYSATRSIAYWDWYQNTGDAPADENTYPTATPSSIASASSTFEVKGDGSGKWGPLTFNADGTVTGIARTASGQLTHGNVTALGSLSFSVTLPPGVFTTPPNVVAGPGQGWLIALAKNITTTSFTCEVHNSRNTAITGTYTINWIARADA